MSSVNNQMMGLPVEPVERRSQPTFPVDAAHEEKIVIRPFPKIVVYIPTMLAALAAGVLVQIFPNDGEFRRVVAIVFMVCFFLNTILVAFEFPRMTAVAVVLLLIAVVFGLLLLNQHFGVLGWLGQAFALWSPDANTQLYFSIALAFGCMFAIAWLITRFDYWIVTNNELLHHHGPFGDMERFPAPQLKLDKEIPDIFEYLVFGSGRLVFYPTSERRALILENVVAVNRVEQDIKHLLEALEVRLEND